jgi:hypothetical protein
LNRSLDLAIVSGGWPLRYRSGANHALYADVMGLIHHLDNTYYKRLQTPSFHKLAAILRVLDRHDWVMWMDDDAFFMDFEQDVRQFVEWVPADTIFVACRSPVTATGDWTFLNAGVFFVRNCDQGRRLLEQAFSTPRADVIAAWRPQVYGFLTSGDQANLIHVLHRDYLTTHIILHDWSAFNARPHHWPRGAPANTYPVVHFAGAEGDRRAAIAAFGDRFGLDDTLTPPGLLEARGISRGESPNALLLLAGRILRWAHRSWRRLATAF